ncbi:MAG: hypothetical protein ACOY93_05235 [Bacillota bacterium]
MTPFEKLLVAHLVGDWILAQTTWEALNKEKNWLACGSHALKWTLCLLAGLWWIREWGAFSWKQDATLLITLAAMGLLHGLLDRRWLVERIIQVKEYIPLGLPLMAPGSGEKPPFFVVICVDQVLHVVQVAVLASLAAA